MKIREAIWPAFGPTKDYACLRVTENNIVATAAVPQYSDGKIVIEGAQSSVNIDDVLKAIVTVCGADTARRMFESALAE